MGKLRSATESEILLAAREQLRRDNVEPHLVCDYDGDVFRVVSVDGDAIFGWWRTPDATWEATVRRKGESCACRLTDAGHVWLAERTSQRTGGSRVQGSEEVGRL